MEGIWKFRRPQRRMKASIWRISGPILSLSTVMWSKLAELGVFFWCRRKEVFTHLPKSAAACPGEALKCSLPNARCPAFPLQNQESQIFICGQHEQIIQNSPNRKKAPNCALKNSLPWEGTHEHTWKYLRHANMHFLHHSELTSLLNLHSLQHGLRRENKWHTRPHREAIWLPAKHLLA